MTARNVPSAVARKRQLSGDEFSSPKLRLAIVRTWREPDKHRSKVKCQHTYAAPPPKTPNKEGEQRR
jgi:hypothetical protein